MPLTNFNLSSEEEESNNELFMSKQGNDDDEIMSKKEEEDLVKILGDDITGDVDGVYNQLAAKVEELEAVKKAQQYHTLTLFVLFLFLGACSVLSFIVFLCVYVHSLTPVGCCLMHQR